MSEHAMGQACRLLTAMLLPFLQRWYRKDGKRCSRRETLSFELCTGLSLKEFGSLLNFLRTRPMLQRDTGGPGYSVHIDI